MAKKELFLFTMISTIELEPVVIQSIWTICFKGFQNLETGKQLVNVAISGFHRSIFFRQLTELKKLRK